MAGFGLEGKVVLVTGASRGIGAAIADKVAASGANVVLSARSPDLLRDRASDLSSRYGVKCLPFEADVSDAVQVSELSKFVFKNFKRLDGLVNNAGILQDNLIGMISQEEINRTIGVNLVGMINCIQTTARLIQRTGGGSVVNISSIVGVRGNAGQLVYGASKGGVIGATLSAAKELASKNIRVNAIAPGYIDTDMIKHIDETVHRQRIESIAMGRVGTPEDVADVVLFLLSSFSRYVTGQVIGVDGGMLI